MLRSSVVLLLAGCVRPEPLDLLAFDEVVFYDGYAELVDEPVPEGVTRLSNDRITRKLSEDELRSVLDTLTLEVELGARCDNYDRLGGVALAQVPSGSTAYTDDDVQRVELARFVTPFMDMRRQPDTITFTYDLTPVVPLFDPKADHDVWIELEVFGVPYAANEEIPGCAGRNDVFDGTLRLTSGEGEVDGPDRVLPVVYRAPFNNYQEGASDALGTTRKTLTYTLDDDASNVDLALVLSNHGANAGGEEYERRVHNVSVDGRLVHSFTPGRTSCEPFRELNTQPNGIYGASPRTDAEWQSFSNWCPGDVIDTRTIELGAQEAGEHTVVIGVPTARFVDGQGNFPLSLHVLVTD